MADVQSFCVLVNCAMWSRGRLTNQTGQLLMGMQTTQLFIVTEFLVVVVDMTEDCIGMVIAIFGYCFSINNINATQILYYTADK